MGKFRVLLTDGLQQLGKDLISSEDEFIDRKGISAQELMKEIPAYDAVIVRGRTKMTRDVIKNAHKLKVIGRCGVGVDNIDLGAAKEKGIIVVNAPVATTTSVAELTMGLIYSLAREIPRASAGLKQGEWLKKSLVGIELNGRSVGIIGYGRIGRMVAKLASSVGMDINAFGPHLTKESKIVEGGRIMSFKQVLQNSDFITIHTPLKDNTIQMIDEKAIDLMKDGVRIVCTARGGIIDESALLQGLNSGKIAGAALDVFEAEPPTNEELLRHPNLIATPHIGGQTIDSQLRASIDIASEVLAALNGKELRWKIV